MRASPAVVAARYVASAIRSPRHCVIWAFGVSGGGYGALRVDGKQIKATHYVLELSGRPRPSGAHALHSCDNPPCINPAHLRWGTHAENMREKVERGRARGPAGVSRNVGTANPKATVTDARVAEAKRRARAGERVADLAAEFGVAIPTIYSWKNGHRRQVA